MIKKTYLYDFGAFHSNNNCDAACAKWFNEKNQFFSVPRSEEAHLSRYPKISIRNGHLFAPIPFTARISACDKQLIIFLVFNSRNSIGFIQPSLQRNFLFRFSIRNHFMKLLPYKLYIFSAQVVHLLATISTKTSNINLI